MFNMKSLFAVLFFISLGQIHAQSSVEPAYLDSLAEFAYDQIFDEPERGKLLAENILQESEMLGYFSGQAYAHLMLGIYYRRSAKFGQSMEHLLLAEVQSGHLQSTRMNQGILWQYLGEVHENIGNVEEAALLYAKAFDFYEESGNVDRQITGAILHGIFYGRRGLYKEALEKFSLALDQTLKADTSVERTRGHLINIYNDLGMLYQLTGELERAKKYVMLSIKVAGQDVGALPPLYTTLAGLYELEKDWDSAMHYFKMGYELGIDQGELRAVVDAAQGISGLFSGPLNQTDSARIYLNEAIKYTQSMGSPRETSLLHYGLARFHFDNGAFDASIYYSKLGLVAFQEQQDYSMLEKTYELLWQSKLALGEPDSALLFHQELKKVSDTILSNTNDRQYSNLRIRLETLLEKQRIEELERQLSSRRLQFIAFSIITGLIVILGCIGWLWFRTESRRKAIALEYSELRRKNSEQELKNKEQELVDHTLHMIKKNQFIEEMEVLAKRSLKQTADNNDLSQKLIKTINLSKSADKDWAEFSKYFGQVHAEFFEKLKRKYPRLSNGELRHCALVKMNMSLKESSQIMGVDPASIKVARYRIKKKMQLPETENLRQHLTRV